MNLELNLPITINGLPEDSSATASLVNNQLVIEVTTAVTPPNPEEFSAVLKSRDDYSLLVTVTGQGVTYVVVENGTYHWRGDPVACAPGDVPVILTDPHDFAKFMCAGQAIDVPSAQEAADYVPEGGEPVPPDPPPCGDGSIENIASRMGFGVNIERGRPFINFGLQDPVNTKHFADYYKPLGCHHVRLFYPWRPGGGWWDGQYLPMLDTPIGQRPSRDQIKRLVDCAKNLAAEDIIVFYDCTDVMSHDRDCGQYGELVEPMLRDTAALILEAGIPPSHIVVGAINEHEGSDNQTWNPIRQKYLDVLHESLPGYVLCTGGANWKDSAHFLRDDYAIWGVAPTFHDVHNYFPGWYDFAGVGNALRAKHSRLGTYGLYGELGPGGGDQGQQYQTWVQTMEASYPHLLDQHVTLWAVTDGSAWVMNRGWGDPRLWDGSQGWDPQIEQTFSKYAKQALA